MLLLKIVYMFTQTYQRTIESKLGNYADVSLLYAPPVNPNAFIQDVSKGVKWDNGAGSFKVSPKRGITQFAKFGFDLHILYIPS